jgi:hypothetical protein
VRQRDLSSDFQKALRIQGVQLAITGWVVTQGQSLRDSHVERSGKQARKVVAYDAYPLPVA